ncbi:MAG: alpha/beta hydrolase family protein, partial [Woeseiaceae bacterium]
MWKMNAILFILMMPISLGLAAAEPDLLTSADLANFENPPAAARIHYGDGALQFGDLRLPAGSGPHPVAVFIHGGCWLSAFDIAHSSKLTAAMARYGIATWSLEYRRVGDEGGGWPGTFQDVASGADHLAS